MRTMWSATVFGAAALLALAASAGAGVVVSPATGYSIAWDGSDGAFFNPSVPATVPSNLANSGGVTAFGSSAYPSTSHTIAHANDGLYGNTNSWLASSGDSNPYIGLDLGHLRAISAIAWSRDNGNTVEPGTGGTGTYSDRWQATYTLQYTYMASPGTGTTETGNPATGWANVGTLDYQSNDDTVLGGLFTGYYRHQYDVSAGGTPLLATGVRVKPSSNGTCIDEVELYGGDVQIQLQATGGGPCPNNFATRPGATAFALNCISGYTSHAIDHLNDGLYGNTSSWIGISGPSFAGIDLNGPATINAIAFGRDNGGEPPERPEPYTDRWAGTYTLQYTTIASPDETTPDADWVTIGTLTYDSTFPDATPYLRHVWMFDTIEGATGVRVLTGTNGTGIDELEVCFIPEPATLALVAGGLLALVRRRAARR